MRLILLILMTLTIFTTPVKSMELDILELQNFELSTKTLSSLRQIHEMISEEMVRDVINSPTVDPKLVKHYEKVLQRAVFHLIKEQMDPDFNKTRFEKVKEILLMDINWKKVSQYFLEQVRAMKMFGKMHGFGLLGAAVITNILQIIVPPIVFTMAGPVASAISFVALGNGPTVFYYHAATFYQNRQKLIKFFKGKDNLKKFKTVMHKVYETLSIDSIDDMIVPMSHEKLHKYGIKVSNESILNRLLKVVGFRKNTLNRDSLNKFLESENIDDPTIKLINSSKKLKASQKSFFTILQLNNIMTPQQAAAFHTRFSKYIVANTLPEHTHQLTSWVDNAVIASKTARDLFNLIDDIPADSNPMEVVYLWDRVVMPELAKRDKIFGMFQFRKLRETLPSIQSEVYLSKRSQMDFEMKFAFKKYIKSAMTKKRKDCFQTHNQVIDHLIQTNLFLAP